MPADHALPRAPRTAKAPRRLLAALTAGLLAATVLAVDRPAQAAVPVGPVAGATVTGGKMPGATVAVAPAIDAFHTPPSPLPAGRPGDVIRWRRSTVAPLGGVLKPAPADAYQVMFLSRDDVDRPIAITGTVLVPKGRNPATMPIVGYAPTTHGIGDVCAASKELVAGGDTDLVNVNDALTRGWAVAEGDYQGLGTPGEHTYVVGRAEAHSVLDAVRAAQRLTVAGLPRAGSVALWGYSQGGGAAAWAAQLAPTYAPELAVKGTAAGGTPADLDVVAGALNNGPGFAYLMMAASGLNAAYPELKLTSYLNDKGRAVLVDLQSTCVNEALLSYAFGSIATYTTSNPLARPEWQARVKQQKLGLIAPTTPVLLYQGFQDEFIPWAQADQLRKDWCARGAKVRMNSYLGDHISTFVSGQVDAQNYLADRFAGRTAPTSC